jgi:hypothetical protein
VIPKALDPWRSSAGANLLGVGCKTLQILTYNFPPLNGLQRFVSNL